MTLPVRLGLFYGAIFIGTGVSSPYLPVWFADHGLSGAHRKCNLVEDMG